MTELTDAQIDAALKRGTAAHRSDPRAGWVVYEPPRIKIMLKNGCVFAFPIRLVKGFEKATVDQIMSVRILGDGIGLHWEELDIDLSVPELIANLSGVKSYLARKAGGGTSQAKAAAARANGAKGGRPTSPKT